LTADAAPHKRRIAVAAVVVTYISGLP